SNETGIYVGESNDVVVRNNLAFDNVVGIEIENCVNVRAVYNVVYNNTLGILEDLLPGFPMHYWSSSGNVIASNWVINNNRPNTAAPDDIASTIKSGTGIALVGGDHTVVQRNVVIGNSEMGIIVLSGN